MKHYKPGYQFELDIKKAEYLDKVYSDNLYRIEQRNNVNIICTYIMRIKAVIVYLNDKILYQSYFHKFEKCEAFDFYDTLLLINNLINYIDGVVKVYDLKDNARYIELLNSKDIFNQPDYSDREYIKYLRSLCVIHPDNTTMADKEHNRGKRSNDDDVINNTCYCVRWVYDNLSLIKALDNNPPSVERLDIYSFEKMTQKYISILDIIIDKIENEKYSLVNEELKEESDFNTYSEYLDYLSIERQKRLGNKSVDGHCIEDIFYIFKKILKIECTDIRNKEFVEKYKLAIKLGINFEAHRIKTMCSDGYENTGIKIENEKCSLLEILKCNDPSKLEIYNPLVNESAEILYYSINKRYRFIVDDIELTNKERVKKEILKYKEMFNEYLYFDESVNFDEMLLLINTFIYLYEMEDKMSILSLSLPYDIKYRTEKSMKNKVAIGDD